MDTSEHNGQAEYKGYAASASCYLSSELLYAVQSESLDTVRKLLTGGADLHALHQTLYQNLVFFATTRPAKEKNDRRLLIELLVETHGLDAAAVDALEQTPLFYAAREGDVEACKYLIAQGCEADHVDSNRQTPIFYAAKSGVRECVEFLLASRCEADRTDMNKQSPLFYAASAPSAEALLDAKCDPNKRDMEGQSCIFFAASKGAADRVRLLVANQADVNLTDTAGTTCLFHAAKFGQAEMCQLLCETYGVDPLQTDHQTPGRTARQTAEAWKQWAVMKVLEALERKRRGDKKSATARRSAAVVASGAGMPLATPAAAAVSLGKRLYDAVRDAPIEEAVRLLKAKAQPESVAVGGGENLVFMAAARAQGAKEMCSLLVEHKLDPTVVDTRLLQTPLFFSVRSGVKAGGLSCALYLLGARCDADHSDLRGETPLFYAVQRADAGCAEALLAAGAKASHMNQFGGTAAFYAARAGAVASMKALLRAGADASTCDQRGQTALWEAASPGFAALLLMHGADPMHRSTAGQTALMAAAEKGADEVLWELVDWGGDPHAKDPSGQSCVFYAARRGHARTCRYLLEECDIEPAHCDKDGASALDVASSGGHSEAAKVIRERMELKVAAREQLEAQRKRPADPGEARSLESTARRRRTLLFRDNDGQALLPGTAEYATALRSLTGVCPWLDGWGG